MFTALSLARAGVDVEVIDQAARRAGHSYAVGLHPASVLLLDQLGLLEPLLAHGQRVDAVLLHGSDGARRVPLDGLAGGRAFGLAVPQQRLEELLERELHAKGVRLSWNHRLADLAAEGDPPLATVERLGKDSAGYPYAAAGTVVDRTHLLHPRFVVGADGHRSTVAARLGIVSQPVAEAQTFVAFEVGPREADSGHDLHLIVDAQSVDAIWPLPEGRLRCTFELGGEEAIEAERFKDRHPWWVTPPGAAALLAELLAARAPWLGPVGEIGWSALARFERRLVPSWGRGRTWLLGDAAHLASPLAAHSLNRGLREGDALAGTIAAILGGGAGDEALEAWAARSRAEWDWLQASPGASPALAAVPENGRLLPALPATGEALRELLGRLALAA
jgi:2-polyprenyl-6-methoxyphenol hydroxylase-like FAD-dependent oxidoreductase